MDFMMNTFNRLKCNICKQWFRSISFDKETLTCPRCMNGVESEEK